jgi:BASS family bile acid:Na+ symporter
MMIKFLEIALNVSVVVFTVASLLECGLGLTLAQIVQPLRNARIVITSAVVSHLLVPLIAVVVSRLFGIDEHLRHGLVLFALVAGVEIVPKLAGMAKADVALAVGLMIAQLGVTIIYVPLVLYLLLPEVHFDHVSLLAKLCVIVGLPIGLGLFLKKRRETLADRLIPYLHKLGMVFLVVMLGLLLFLTYRDIFKLVGSGALGAASVLIAVSFLTGYLLGGPKVVTRKTLALTSGMRNGTVAIMIASQTFHDPEALTMIVVAVVVMDLIMVPTVFWLGRRAASGGDPSLSGRLSP